MSFFSRFVDFWSICVRTKLAFRTRESTLAKANQNWRNSTTSKEVDIDVMRPIFNVFDFPVFTGSGGLWRPDYEKKTCLKSQ